LAKAGRDRTKVNVNDSFIRLVPQVRPSVWELTWDHPWTYDGMGNLKSSGDHTYAYDSEGRPVTVDSVQVMYDAFERPVEEESGGHLQPDSLFAQRTEVRLHDRIDCQSVSGFAGRGNAGGIHGGPAGLGGLLSALRLAGFEPILGHDEWHGLFR